MCVCTFSRSSMGCGKSRYPSPVGSETDLPQAGAKSKNSENSFGLDQGASSNSKKKGSSGGANGDSKKGKDKKGSKDSKSSPYRKGTTERSGSFSKSKDTGSPKIKVTGTGDKTNGAMTHPRTVTLEVPEMVKLDVPPTRTQPKDFKSITANKIVRVTNSQIEFFRMLDDKIEQGAGHMTSGEVSEVSSIDEAAEYDEDMLQMSPNPPSQLQ